MKSNPPNNSLQPTAVGRLLRGQSLSPAVAEFCTLGHLTTLMKTIAVILFAAFAMQAKAAEKLFDDNLATNAVAVVRVHMLWSIQIPKYPVTRYNVHVYQVFKNESRENFYQNLEVFAFRGRDGVPPGDCTVYIARYNLKKMAFEDTNGSIWMLIGGDATNGVSHVYGKAVLR
jgi:hypothetical protein